MEPIGPTYPNAAMCFGYLSMAYEFSDACSMNYTCLCSNTNFMQTCVSCVHEISKLNHNFEYDLNASINSIVQFCPSANFTQLVQYLSSSSHLSAYSGDTKTAKIGYWKADSPFKPSKFDIKHAYEAYYSLAKSRSSSQRFGAALLAFWGGVLFLHAVFHGWKRMFPQSYMKMANSKLGRQWRKYLTISTFTCFSPSNLLTLEITAFFIISMIFTFAGLPLFRDNYTYMFKQSISYGLFCGIRSGYLAVYIAPIMVLFAGRNNFLQGLSGLSQDKYVYFHRWTARIEILLVFIHAIAYTILLLVGHDYADAWTRAFWNWGIVALAFGCFMVAQAIRFVRRWAYETFLMFHIISAVFYIVGGYYHIYKMEVQKGLGFFYAMIAVWGYDRDARLLRICFSNPGQKSVLRLNSDMLTITAPVPIWWNLRNNPGTYLFVHFLNKRHFHQSHPFTMYMNPDNLDELKLICRVKNGITKTMNKMITANGGELETRICLDGPYGHSHRLDIYEELVFFAGGVGITAVFSYTQQLLLQDIKRDQCIKIFWAVRDASAESWFKPELEFLRSHFTVDINLYVGDGRVEKQQPIDVAFTVKNVLSTANGSMGILCCGPDGMNKDARANIAANLHLTKYYVHYFEESFSW